MHVHRVRERLHGENKNLTVDKRSDICFLFSRFIQKVVLGLEAKMFLEITCSPLRDGRCHVNPRLERLTTRCEKPKEAEGH